MRNERNQVAIFGSDTNEMYDAHGVDEPGVRRQVYRNELGDRRRQM